MVYSMVIKKYQFADLTSLKYLVGMHTEQGPECVDGFRLRLRTRTLVRRRNRYGERENFHFVVRK